MVTVSIRPSAFEFLSKTKVLHGVIDQQPIRCKALSRLWRPLTRIVEDPQLTQVAAQMEKKVEIFEKMRQALSIALRRQKSSERRCREADIKASSRK